MHNIVLIIAYDGQSFLGWQKTKMGPSIEAALQETLEKILQHPITLQAASRTDAGVHAHGQVVNFFTRCNLHLDRLKASCNALLPPTIRLLDAQFVPLDFHPTLHCLKKTYRYHVCLSPIQLPWQRHYSWHFPMPLDLDAMQQAGKQLLGTHDFSAFCNQRKGLCYPSFERTLYQLNIQKNSEDLLTFHLEGPSFLYKMVRNIVGTLVYVGCGKLSVNGISHILASKDRRLAGVTAPAHGLTLASITYPPPQKDTAYDWQK